MRPLALALMVLSVASVVQAEEPEATTLPSDEQLAIDLQDPDTTASQAYELGVSLFEAKRYAAAEQAWQRSNELKADPVLLIAIADAREQQDDEPGAVAMLEEYLRLRPDAPDKPAIEARIATLLKAPASVTVRSTEEGHAILVDGKPIDRKTPAEIELEPGAHTILVVGDGKRVGEKKVQLGYGEQKELVFTAATPSEVVVEEDPTLELREEERTAKRAVWALTGIAAGALVTGTALGVAALKQEDNFNADPTTETANKGDRLALFADLSFGLAAVSAITALTVFLTTRKKSKRKERPTARLRLDRRGGGATATFRF